MPKAKVNHSGDSQASSTGVSRTPVKINSTQTPLWYKILMFTCILAGLLWLVVYYIAGPQIPFMIELNVWNYLIGFGLFIIGLLMTMGWK
ncbi:MULTISPECIES: cell division protein CrgA [unclassified Corynebacterium]|uniref:cell division protein CrgA n=1 Tax=unclassified Corynebacterium TaxID=2624378 RepID=UPI0030A6801B